MPTTLYVRQQNGRYIAANPQTVTQTAAHIMATENVRLRRGHKLSSPESVRDFIRMRLALLPHEIFGMLMLDNRNRFISDAELFRGTIDGASVHPREVVKTALEANAACLILYHNHPSGDPDPSQADEVITRRLKAACALVDIRIIDHIVVGTLGSVSFAERGLI